MPLNTKIRSPGRNPAATAGEGVYSYTTNAFCTHNTVSNFANPYFSCDFSANNLPVLP